MMLDAILKLLALTITLFGSAFQAYGNLVKRSIWISQAESAVGSLGMPYWAINTLPRWICSTALVLVTVLSLGAFWGGTEMFIAATEQKTGASGGTQSTAQVDHHMDVGLGALVGGIQAVPLSQNSSGQTTPSEASGPWVWLFQHSLHLLFVYFVIGVLSFFNLIPKTFLFASRLLAMRDKELLYHPGWINAYWHVTREENAVPINTNADNCRFVADTYVTKAAIEGLDYDQHRAEKPGGLTPDELANVLLIANLIELCLHHNRQGHKFAFGALYQKLGARAAAADRLFSPEQVIELYAKKRSLYASLRDSIPDLPDVASIGATVRECVEILAQGYAGRASELARPTGGGDYNVQVLASRLERLPGFRDDRPMRAEVTKLGIDWGVWPGMFPGPFAYPFTQQLARMLFNLGCLCTKPDVKAIACDDEFQRLNAWTLDRIADAADRLLKSSPDDRVRAFCQTRFGSQPEDIERWKLCRDLDYFLWVQSEKKDPASSVFGDQGAAPWKVDGNNLTKG